MIVVLVADALVVIHCCGHCCGRCSGCLDCDCCLLDSNSCGCSVTLGGCCGCVATLQEAFGLKTLV